MRANLPTWWKSKFGNIAPVGHALREFLHSKWTRFHSLPGSKRYPETGEEMRELVARHSQVASELFVFGEPLYVFQSRYPASKRRSRATFAVAGRQLREASLTLPVSAGVVSEDNEVLVTRGLETTWKPDFFDRLVAEVATEQERHVALVAPSSKNVYCPYDGGMDIFAFSTTPAALEKKFSSWLSEREDRL